MAEAKIKELEAMISSIQKDLLLRPTAQHIKEEMDKRLKLIETLLEKMPGKYEKNEFNTKDANFQRPKAWTGSKDKADFVEFSNAVKSWAVVLHDKGVEIIENTK